MVQKEQKKNDSKHWLALQHVSRGFLTQADMHPTRENKVASQTAASHGKRMQHSIFSNTVYKTQPKRVRCGFPTRGGPAAEAMTGSLHFWGSNFSVHPCGRKEMETVLLIELFYTSKSWSCQRGIHSAQFYDRVIAFSVFEWQLPHAALFNFVLQMWERCPI